MEKVIPEQQLDREMVEEMVNILHSLRMLSLHVVKCVIDWRKQLVCNYLVGQNLAQRPQEQIVNNRFKNVPFVYEEQNYLLKMHQDTAFLLQSHFNRFFNFSPKSDPFLVFPSQKHATPAVGGAANLKKLRKQQPKIQQLTIPLQNNLMKMIRQSEVYMMEEAVTQQMLQGGSELFSPKESARYSQDKENTNYNSQPIQPKQDMEMVPAHKKGRIHMDMENAVLASSNLNSIQQKPAEIDSDIIDIKAHPLQQEDTEMLDKTQAEDTRIEQEEYRVEDVHFGTTAASEATLHANLEAYYALLSDPIRKTFPPVDELINLTLKAYDAHFIDILSPANQIVGKICFNVDTML